MKRLMGLLIATTLALGSGCAKQDWIDRTLVTVDVTGTWSGTGPGGSRVYVFEFEQQGSTVKGYMQVSGAGTQVGVTPGPIAGSVAGDVLHFTDSRGILDGTLTVSGDEMEGQASVYGGSFPISLRRVDPSSRPVSPPR
jgi:hypothetical protein